MIPWVILDTAKIPGSEAELKLHQRGKEFSISIDGEGELMNSTMHGSEEALAELTCTRLSGMPDAKVLIGGLGMGFTLGAAVRLVNKTALVEVAELVPSVVEWNRKYLSHLANNPLDDPRVQIFEGDVANAIRNQKKYYDAILLDVDNGPDGLTHQNNDWLYGMAGLQACKNALKIKGVLAVWSAAPDRFFTKRLRKVGFEAEEKTVRAHGKRGTRHTIWLAKKKS